MSADRLELEQDAAFQRREWRIQRVGWAIWAAIVLAALAGLTGPGPLSHREAATADGRLSVKYDRFVHYHHPTPIEVTLRPASETDDRLRLRLSQSMLDRILIERIEPEPMSRELTAGGVWYEFAREQSADDVKVLFHIEYEAMGRGNGDLQLAGSEPVAINTFVYP
jgi:hypothetical protein